MPRHYTTRKQRANLGSENKSIWDFGIRISAFVLRIKGGRLRVRTSRIVIERLDTETIASQEQRLTLLFALCPSPVPHGKRKHAFQMLYALRSPFLISMGHHFRIRAGVKSVAAILELLL